MTPQVRETEKPQIEGPRTSAPDTMAINVLHIAQPIVEIKAPSPEVTEESGPSMLDKRRRRHARLRNRR